MTLGDDTVIRFTLDGSTSLDDERRQLIEELCRLVGERLERSGNDDVTE